MTRVDFYVLANSSERDHERMICRVVEKAFRHGHEIYVLCCDAAEVKRFDETLWRFQDTSFVPHVCDSGDAPVVIGTTASDIANPDVLVNLANEVPDTVSSFQRVIESAGFDDPTRGAARTRYRYYQDRGFPLHTHKISA
jgi:DNA polymerase III subunit chi